MKLSDCKILGKYTDQIESSKTYGNCGKCGKPVGAILGATFKLNGIIYHHDCFPREDAGVTYFARSGQMYSSNVTADLTLIEDKEGKKWVLIS